MKCLIIAAGQGSRLRQRTESKPLVQINGTPLIDRVIAAARDGGADEFYVVSGYRGPMLRSHLDRLSKSEGLAIHHIVNDRWREPNGVSVLQAKHALQVPFLLLMSDHLFDPRIVRDLVSSAEPGDGVILATDSNLRNPLVDLADVTRVREQGGIIQDIGKGLSQYNAFDTGIFYCAPSLFGALEESMNRGGEASLSGGVRVLAETRSASTWDIGGRFWLDVDDSRTYVKAEVMLDQMNTECEIPNFAYPAH